MAAKSKKKGAKGKAAKPKADPVDALKARRAGKELAAADLKKIQVYIASQVMVFAKHFVPLVGDAIQQTDKTISWGVNITAKMSGNGTVECSIKPRAPKVPMPNLEDQPFLLQISAQTKQLEFVFGGSSEQLQAEAESSEIATGSGGNGAAAPGGDGDYQPGDNAQSGASGEEEDPDDISTQPLH